MAKWEIIEDNKFKKQTGGAAVTRAIAPKKTVAKAADDIPKFKKGGKTNLNSTVQEEPKNTVKVNQNGQIIEYDPSSPEYKKLYESGTLTSYDPETDAYITPTLKEFTVVGEKPKWAKEKENNQSKYSKDWYIDNYLPKFSRNMGISANNMNPNDVERYNSFINDKTVEDIFKRYPLFDSDYANDRLGTLKQFSPKEVELIKNSSYANKIQPSVWQDFEEGLLLLNSGPVQFKNENLTQEEAQEASSALNLLAPLSIPYNMTTGNAYTQQQGEKNYSWEKALKGQKPIHTSIAASIAGDPLNLLGLGLFKGLVSAGKIAKLEDAYQLVKGLGKEEALSKLKSLTSLDNYEREAFTPMLDNVGVEAFGAGKPTAFKSEINWGNWNPDTPKYPELINEYNAIEQTTKANGTWMKNSDGSAFQGTPEQFIQQQSSWFKKAFLDYYGEILNHNSPNKFDKFENNFFGTTSDRGWYGEGIYTHPSEKYTQEYGINNYKLYTNSKNKGFINKDNYKASKSYNRNYDRELKNLEKNKELEIKEIYENPKDYENTEFWKNIIENQYNRIKKKLIEEQQEGLKHNINQYSTLTNPQNGEVVIPFNNPVKSAIGNVGFFDMTNPNIYKAIIPTVLGVGALNQKQKGGAIITNRGQWDYPGQTTIIPSNQITMQGVNYPVLGISDRGHTQMMYPGLNYSFKGNSVTEYPMMQSGGRYISESVQPQPSKNYTGTFLPINRDLYGNARKKLFDNENKNPSTESVIGINDDSGYYNIPTVINGVRFSDENAVNNFYNNGMYHTGHFNTQEEADKYADSRERANIGLFSTGLYKYGGEVNFTYAGEDHRVYKKESPTGNGKGIKGHIMVNHPTEDKGKWDTIDLTKITNGKVKTVAQGVASTKKWHKENPEYADGGQVSSWEIIEDSDELDEFKHGGKTPVWQRKEGKSPTGGLNAKGRASLKKEGHDIKPPQPQGGSRKKSFCARMTGLKKKLTGSKKANDPNSRVNLSLKKWKC